MIIHRFIAESDAHYLRAVDPFSMDQIYEYSLRMMQSGDASSDISLPVFWDFRWVNLLHCKVEELRRHIGRRDRLGKAYRNNPTAIVVGDQGSFGMMRMYGILADLEGLRDESRTLVTLDFRAAIDWLVATTEKPYPEDDRFREALRIACAATTFQTASLTS